jgi:hypothetical protein
MEGLRGVAGKGEGLTTKKHKGIWEGNGTVLYLGCELSKLIELDIRVNYVGYKLKNKQNFFLNEVLLD